VGEGYGVDGGMGGNLGSWMLDFGGLTFFVWVFRFFRFFF
jgi:hypothetical protein